MNDQQPTINAAGRADGAAPAAPSQRIIQDAARLVTITAADGRKVGVRRADLMAEFRLVEALGPEVTKNQKWMDMVMPILFLAELDGAPVDPLRTKLQVEALITRLGHDGYNALMEGVAIIAVGDGTDTTKNS